LAYLVIRYKGLLDSVIRRRTSLLLVPSSDGNEND